MLSHKVLFIFAGVANREVFNLNCIFAHRSINLQPKINKLQRIEVTTHKILPLYGKNLCL